MPTPTTRPPPRRAPRNLGFVEDLYFAWREDPASVDEAWRAYFETLPAVPDAAPAPAAWPCPYRARGARRPPRRPGGLPAPRWTG